MQKAIFIATFLVAAVPCFAQQVRVITGDIEHVYGPGGRLMDDAELRARNERAERQMRQQKPKADLDQSPQWNVQSWRCDDSSCQQAPESWWSVDKNRRQTPKSAWSDPGIPRQRPQSWWSVR